MSIEQIDVVDAVGINKDTDEVVLTISDHLDWAGDHLTLLQDKVNTYLSFVESGQIFFSYPMARGRRIIVEVVCKYQPNDQALQFFKIAEPILASAGVGLRYRVFDAR